MADDKMKKMFQAVQKRVVDLLKPDRFYITLYDRVTAQLEFPLVFGDEKTSWAPRALDEKKISDRILLEGLKRLYELDVADRIDADDFEYWPDEKAPASWLGVPIIFSGKVLGAMVVESQVVGAFGSQSELILEKIAEQVATVIEDIRSDLRIIAINEIGQKLNSQIQYGEKKILELIHEEASNLLYADNMYIALYDEKDDTVSFPVMYMGGVKKEVESRKAGVGRTEYIIENKKALLVETRVKSIKWYAQPGREEYIGDPLASWIGVPMIVGDDVVGVIAAYHRTLDDIYDEKDLQLLQALANQAAIALDNANIYENLDHLVKERTQQLHERNEQLTALQEIGVQITSQLDIEEVVGSVAEAATRLVGADFSTIFTYDHKQQTLGVGIRRGVTDSKPSIPDEKSYTVMIAREQKSEFIETELLDNPTEIDGKPVKSFAVLPLLIGSKNPESVGVLYVDYYEQHIFSEQEKEMLGLLVNQAAVAIQNARLKDFLDKELQKSQSRIWAAERLTTVNSMSSEFAHRLNNLAGTVPVRIDMISTQLDRNNARDRSLLRHLDGIKADVQRLTGMINDLEKGSSSLRLELTDLNDVVNTVAANAYIPPAIKREIRLGKTLPKVNISVDHLSETLNNLISNAIDAMPNGGILIVETLYDEKNQLVLLEVSDTGRGLSEDGKRDIFKLFFTTKPQGLGFGLWRDRNLVEQLGGRLEVESELGRGAKFKLILPVS